MNIYQKINAIMSDVSYVQKEKKEVNGQYRFVSHDAVTSAVQPHLVNHGVVVIPTVTNHVKDGNRTEVDVNVSFVNIEKPEDRFDVQFFGYGIDNQDKGPGKAFSYAKKYAFLQVFCLETGDDPERDSVDHNPKVSDQKRTKTAVAKDIKAFVFAMTQTTTKEALEDFVNGQKEKDLIKELHDQWPDEFSNVKREKEAHLERLNGPAIDSEQLLDDLIKELKLSENTELCIQLKKDHTAALLRAAASPSAIKAYENEWEKHMSEKGIL